MGKDVSKYEPIGTKLCEGNCLRQVMMTDSGPVVVCNGCDRIVIDNRNREDE